MIRRAKSWLLLLLVLLAQAVIGCAVHATEAAPPKILFDAGGTPGGSLLPGEAIEVRSELLQIEIAPGMVLSAGRGAMIALLQPAHADAHLVVAVLAGPVLALNLGLNEVRDLGIGSHLLSLRAAQAGERAAQRTGGAADWALALATSDQERRALGLGQGFQFADSIMIRQQAYLDALRIDVRQINHGLASVIRRFFPGGSK